MKPWKSNTPFLGSSRYNMSKVIKTMTQTHWGHPLYKQGSTYWQMQVLTKHTLAAPSSAKHSFTLHTSGLGCQQLPCYIQPCLICLFGLLHTYHVRLLQRKALLVRRNLSINQLTSIQQGIQLAPHMTLVSIIQAPKLTLANLFCSPPSETSPVSNLSKELSLS